MKKKLVVNSENMEKHLSENNVYTSVILNALNRFHDGSIGKLSKDFLLTIGILEYIK